MKKYALYLCLSLIPQLSHGTAMHPLVDKKTDFGTLYVGYDYTKRIQIMNFNEEPVHDIEFEFFYNGVFDRIRPLYNHDCPKSLEKYKFCYFTIMFTPSFGTLRGELHVYWNNRQYYALSRITGLVTFSNP